MNVSIVGRRTPVMDSLSAILASGKTGSGKQDGQMERQWFTVVGLVFDIIGAPGLLILDQLVCYAPVTARRETLGMSARRLILGTGESRRRMNHAKLKAREADPVRVPTLRRHLRVRHEG